MVSRITNRIDGCPEHRALFSRRSFLGASAALFTSALIPSSAAGSQTTGDPRLLVVILRGGIDGLSTLVPRGDENYQRVRGRLSVDLDRVIPIDGIFGLHPALANINSVYRDGHAAFFPAVGLPVRTRSHFECQANLENGLNSNSASASGWINRLIEEIPNSNLSGGGGPLTVGPVPQILAGRAPIQSWSPNWFGEPIPQVLTALETLYREGHPELAEALARGASLRSMANTHGGSVHDFFNTVLTGFTGAARLLRASSGPRLAVLSVAGWDTHNMQGTLDGQMSNRLAALDGGIGAFRREIGDDVWRKTIIICVSEFGRSAFLNGTSGTDHGIGMPALLFGGALRGGVYGDWPGLRPQDLVDGRDLRPTLDLRSIFKGVLADHCGIAQQLLDNRIFPESGRTAPVFSGFIRGANERLNTPDFVQSSFGPVGRGQILPRDLRAYRVTHGSN